MGSRFRKAGAARPAARTRRLRPLTDRSAAPEETGPAGARDDTEARLLLRIARKRDEAALIELYERISPSIYACCMRILRDEDDAKDATSEAFWRLWTRADRYDPTHCSAMAWIMTVVRRLALDHRRSALRRDNVMHRVHALPAAPDVTVEREEAHYDLQTAFRRLPDADQRILESAYFEGLSGADIAQRDDVPLGTVKSRMRAALRRLRQAVHGSAL